MGWTSIYQLFWGSLGTRVLTHSHTRYPRTRLVWICSFFGPGVFPDPQPVRQKLPATTCSNWLIGQLGVRALDFWVGQTWLFVEGHVHFPHWTSTIWGFYEGNNFDILKAPQANARKQFPEVRCCTTLSEVRKMEKSAQLSIDQLLIFAAQVSSSWPNKNQLCINIPKYDRNHLRFLQKVRVWALVTSVTIGFLSFFIIDFPMFSHGFSIACHGFQPQILHKNAQILRFSVHPGVADRRLGAQGLSPREVGRGDYRIRGRVPRRPRCLDMPRAGNAWSAGRGVTVTGKHRKSDGKSP